MKDSRNKLIIKNTLMLYFRQILIMIVSLYTVRVVLRILGVEDYGVYSVVGGVVSMFSFLSSSMATATQRFFSFDLGREDYSKLKKTFNMSILIFFLIALIVLIFSETLGLWFLNHKIVVPGGRMETAKFVFQLSILSFLVTLMNTPFLAVIIAHENMNLYAWMSILEVFLKLALVLLLQLFDMDKLKLYSILMFLIPLVIFLSYYIVCKKKYRECKFGFEWNLEMFKMMSRFAGWNLFGALSGVLKNQGINILLNMFFGPAVNAARSIASQVSGAVTSFSLNFVTAVRPQIIKQYSAGNHDEMISLVFTSSKMSTYLMYIFVLPLFIEMPSVISLWLGQVPDFVIIFTRLILIDAILSSISNPLMTAAQATGNIKRYQIVVGSILLFNLPLSYIVLKMGARPESVLIIGIVVTMVAFVARLYLAARLVSFSGTSFLTNVFLPVLLVVVTSSITPVVIYQILDESYLRVLISIITSVLSVAVAVFSVGITRKERQYFIQIIKNKVRKN